MRRGLTVSAVAAVMVVALASPVAANTDQGRLPVEFRYVVTADTVVDAFLTGNGKWFHVNEALGAVSGQGTFGDDPYVSTGWSTNRSQLSTTDNPALPIYFGDDGVVHLKADAIFDPVAGGDRVTCSGFFQLKKIPADPPFLFAEEGFARWQCDNGWKVQLDVDGQFEVLPGVPQPVFVLTVSGEAR